MKGRAGTCFLALALFAVMAEAQQPRDGDSREDEDSFFGTTLFRDGNRIAFAPGVLDERALFGEPISLEAQIAGDVALWGQAGVRALEGSAVYGAARRWSSQGYATMMLRLRMMAQTSSPVAPPSFMPKFTYQGIGLKRNRDSGSMVVVNAVFGHHSNGQSGCSLVGQVVEAVSLEDGRQEERCSPIEESIAKTAALNVETGNFSTHYIQASVYHRLIRFGRETGIREISYGVAMEQHQFGMKGAIGPELVERYGMTQVEGVFGFSFRNIWIWDRIDARSSYRHVLGDVAINRAFATEYLLYFKAKPDVGVFFRNYSGRDYYNINFERNLRRVEIGLTFNWEGITRAVPRGL